MQDRIHGTTMPVLEVVLEAGESVLGESGELSWMTPSISLQTTYGGGGVKGLFKRAVGGGTLFMTTYTAEGAAGSISFAAKLPGAILPVDINKQPGGTWIGHRHGFVCGTTGIELSVALQQRLGAGLFGGNGFLLQKIGGSGRAWVELSGEVVTFDLAPGESLRVHPGHIGLFQDTVTYNLTSVPGIKNKIFGGDGIFLANLIGPGRVYLQSLPISRLAAAIAEYLPGDGGGTAGTIGAAAGGFGAASILDGLFGKD